MPDTFVTGSNSVLLYDILKREHTENDYLKINSKSSFTESLTIGISIFIGGELAAYSMESCLWYSDNYHALCNCIFKKY